MTKLTIPGKDYRATVFGVSAVCKLDGNATGATLYYPRHTRLGECLRQNAKQERAILANYIRQSEGWPRGEHDATRITFNGV